MTLCRAPQVVYIACEHDKMSAMQEGTNHLHRETGHVHRRQSAVCARSHKA